MSSTNTSSFQNLPVKTLVKILSHLNNGNLGFDPYRDERTNKKDKLLAYILSSHGNQEIVDATTAVLKAQEASGGDVGCFTADHVTITYKDVNGTPHVRRCYDQTEADAFINGNPMHQYTGKYSEAQWQSMQETAKQAKGFIDDARTPILSLPVAVTPDASTETLQIAAMLASLAKKGSVDESKVTAICDARAQTYVDNILEAVNTRLSSYDEKITALQFPTTVNFLKAPDMKPVDLGLQHKNFPALLKMSQARMRDNSRLNIWLKGPAGSGKTTAAKKVSEALEMPFHFNGAISTEYELMGFKDASGAYHKTAFRDAFENGGVYLFDEIDSSLPKAVLAFNAALANGRCQFPDAQIERHTDCVIIAGANTAGNGASSDYVGRMKQDMAFLNRFVMLDWPLDEAFEKSLAGNKDWCRKVQKFRSNAEKRKIKGHIISPRATFYGEALLAAGLDEELVEHAVLKGALSQDQWEQLCQ